MTTDTVAEQLTGCLCRMFMRSLSDSRQRFLFFSFFLKKKACFMFSFRAGRSLAGERRLDWRFLGLLH